jgi:EAL domain-containing protein (putative c-di-GMP-specific phosphodiesterase class I)
MEWFLGYEALSRGPQNTQMQNPQKLFEFAQKYQKLWELELLCRTKSAGSSKQQR